MSKQIKFPRFLTKLSYPFLLLHKHVRAAKLCDASVHVTCTYIGPLFFGYCVVCVCVCECVCVCV